MGREHWTVVLGALRVVRCRGRPLSMAVKQLRMPSPSRPEIVKSAQRSGDLAARYGGEDSSIILPSTPVYSAQSWPTGYAI